MTSERLPNLAGSKVVLTGATGFVGARVLAACVAAGAEVSAIVRSRRGEEAVSAAGAAPVRADLRDVRTLKAVMSGCDALCHLAYDIRAGEAENLAVFDAVLAAAEEAGIGRFIQTSSVVVYDDWPAKDLTEECPKSGQSGGPYGRAKIEMEHRVHTSPLPSITLQPTLVYGPGSLLWTNHFADALQGRGLVLPTPEGCCNAVYVDDVAQAFLRAIALDDPKSDTFLISGATPVDWSALLEGYRAIVGGTLIREPADEIAASLGPEHTGQSSVPLAARVSAMGRRIIGNERFEQVVSIAKRLKPSGQQGPVSPDHHMLRLFTSKGAVRIDHAKDLLGYSPTFDLEAGLRATEPYLRARSGSHD